MVNLERLAQDSFIAYAKKHEPRAANWTLLKKQRKFEWMLEIHTNYMLILDQFKSTIKPVPPNNIGQASFEKGYNMGVQKERMYLVNFIETIRAELTQQLEDFDKRKE